MINGPRPAPGIVTADSPEDRVDPVRLLRFAAALYAGTAVVLWAVATTVAFARSDATGQSTAGERLLDGWSHYDGGWYLQIASGGYSYVPGQQSSIAFFPAYPLLIRFVSPLFGGDHQLAGIVLAAVLGAAAVLLFAWWVSDKLPARAAQLAVIVLVLYPYSFFLFGAVYSDSLFLVTVIGAFLLLDRGHPVLAGLVGIVATADRPVGLAIVIGLIVRAVELRVPQRPPVPFRQLLGGLRLLRLRDAGVLLSALGLIAWCAYLWSEFGDPFAWIAVQQAPGWDQGSGPRTWFKVVYLGTLIKGPVENVLLLSPQALISVTAIALLYQVRRRLGWGYLAYAGVLLIIAVIGTKDFMGSGRYVMSAFPLFAAGAAVLSSPSRRVLCRAVIVVSALGLGLATGFYAGGWEVS